MGYCCVPKCTEHTGRRNKEQGSKISFHSVPKDPRLQKQFVARIRRDIGPHFKITQRTAICSRHYKVEDFYCYDPPSGKRELKPGVLPSIFDFKVQPKPRKSPRKRDPPGERSGQQHVGDGTCSDKEAHLDVHTDNVHDKNILQPFNRSLLELPPSSSCSSDTADEAHLSCLESTGSISGMECEPKPEASAEELKKLLQVTEADKISLLHELDKERQAKKTLESKVAALEKSLDELMQNLKKARSEIADLKSCRMSFEDVKQDRSLLTFYTGMESEEEFLALYRYLDPGEDCENIIQWRGSETTNLKALPKQRGRPHKLKAADQLLLVFCRLRLNLLEKDLAHRFGLGFATVSRMLASWINYMYFRLGCLQLWPSRDYVDKFMPQEFRIRYPSTRVIIDATELKSENPSSFMLKTGLYSFYKSTHTYKGLIGISPNGLVTFVSALYSGCISDEDVTKRCGILDQVYDHGDSIMADKGFNIGNLLPEGVKLNIPPFKISDRQFSKKEIEATQNIASLRVHVERRIARIKNFRILSQIIPQSLACLVNQIWTVCCILTNFQTPIIKQKEENLLEPALYLTEDSSSESEDDSL